MKTIDYLKVLFLSGTLLLLVSCASHKPVASLGFRNTLLSSVIEKNDSIVFPNHFMIERDLDSLNIEVMVSPHKIKKGSEAGVCVWVDADHHADAVVFGNFSGLWIHYRFIIDGEVYPMSYVYMGSFSKNALIYIKRVGNDIVFSYPQDREITRIGLSYLFDGEYSAEKEIALMMYAVHTEGHKPFTVDFDY